MGLCCKCMIVAEMDCTVWNNEAKNGQMVFVCDCPADMHGVASSGHSFMEIREMLGNTSISSFGQFFDICPELALKVIAVRGHDERNDFGQEDVIYLDLSCDIDIICGNDATSASSYKTKGSGFSV